MLKAAAASTRLSGGHRRGEVRGEREILPIPILTILAFRFGKPFAARNGLVKAGTGRNREAARASSHRLRSLGFDPMWLGIIVVMTWKPHPSAGRHERLCDKKRGAGRQLLDDFRRGVAFPILPLRLPSHM
jgi:hypothetical protein